METLWIVVQYFYIISATVVVFLVFVPQPEPTGIVQNLFTPSYKQLLWNWLLKKLFCPWVIPGIPLKEGD